MDKVCGLDVHKDTVKKWLYQAQGLILGTQTTI